MMIKTRIPIYGLLVCPLNWTGRAKSHEQIAVVAKLTGLVAAAAGDPSLTDRTWVLLTEAPEGGWGLWGHAHTNAELVAAARAEIAKLQS